MRNVARRNKNNLFVRRVLEGGSYVSGSDIGEQKPHKEHIAVQSLCMVPGEASALALLTVPLLLGAVTWSLLTAEDQVFSKLNRRSREDELRETLELSKLLAHSGGWRRGVVRCTVAHQSVVQLKGRSVHIVFGCVPPSEFSPRAAG